MRLFVFLLAFSFALPVEGQRLAGLSTRWDDSFSEWVIYGEEETEIGEIVMKWPMRADWQEWVFQFGDLSGTIRVKWRDDPNLWELRAGNLLFTIRTVWRDDWRQWEIKGHGFQMDMKSRWGNILEEWVAQDSLLGLIKVYTAWEGDLRDWVIEDLTAEEVPTAMKLAMVFIPVTYATPKF